MADLGKKRIHTYSAVQKIAYIDDYYEAVGQGRPEARSLNHFANFNHLRPTTFRGWMHHEDELRERFAGAPSRGRLRRQRRQGIGKFFFHSL